MSTIPVNNRLIAKNTIMLYFRMFILLLVNLYSSRIVLQELGVEDFGIYNIVGGIVSLFTFLNSTMSGATSRFMTFTLGEGDGVKLKETFKVTLTLHLYIALLIIIGGETIGLWFINNKLVIPTTRIEAANIVYQLSLLSVIFKTIQVPFNAVIIAHEKMNVYAFIEIINAFVVLCFLYILQISGFDKLIIYAAMLSFVAMMVLCLYVIYCKKNFTECLLRLSSNKDITIPMLSFSGFDLYGNMCVTARTQGINIILNIFFGTAINAVNGIATQVQAAILMLSNNIALAFRPQIIKNYAANNIDLMEKQINYSSMISMILFSIFAIPLILEMPYILTLWLGNIPPHTIEITRIAVISCWIGAINSMLTIPIHATGRIKALSLCGGSIYLLTLPAAYVLIKVYPIPELAYWTTLLFMFLLLICTCVILKTMIPQFSLFKLWFKNLFACFICILIASIVTFFMCNRIESSLLRLSMEVFLYVTNVLVFVYLFVLDKDHRIVVLTLIKQRLNKN